LSIRLFLEDLKRNFKEFSWHTENTSDTGMSQKIWVCFNFYADSLEQMNNLNRALFSSLTKLKKTKHLEFYFFNRYVNSDKQQYQIKLGLVNCDETTLSTLEGLVNEHKVRKEPYDCEMWKVDGLPIDFIKCISCEIFEKIRELNEDKPLTINQLGYLLHFLMNQMDYGYDKELILYESLVYSIEKQLKESSSK
jgi:hypothetical protein